MTPGNIEVPRAAEPRHEKTSRTVGLGGSAVEALVGLAAVVLSILGLAGRLVVPFAAIAVIATGAALLFEAGAVAAQDVGTHGAESEAERAAVKSSIGADSIAGIGAIALGILSLIGLDPMTLLPVAAIILGAGLLLSAGGPVAEREGTHLTRADEITRDSLVAASGVHVLVGAGAVVLGIIGVLGKSPAIMTLIATLSIGAGQLLTGAAIGGRMTTMFRHGT
jgi:hypothetical protein